MKIARDKIFVTTKVAAEHKDYKSAANGIDESLRKIKSAKRKVVKK